MGPQPGKQQLLSFYLNAMLCLMGDDFYNKTKTSLVKTMLSKDILPYSATANDMKNASECKVELSVLKLIAFISWISINKAVSNDTGRERE